MHAKSFDLKSSVSYGKIIAYQLVPPSGKCHSCLHPNLIIPPEDLCSQFMRHLIILTSVQGREVVAVAGVDTRTFTRDGAAASTARYPARHQPPTDHPLRASQTRRVLRARPIRCTLHFAFPEKLLTATKHRHISIN